MSPYEQCEAKYAESWPKCGFEERVIRAMKHGFVFSTPDFFVMGRPVVSTAPHEQIACPAFTFDRSKCDMWHLDWFAGDMHKVWAVLPWPLPYISFERMRSGRLELQIYRETDIHRFTRLAA
jgi:hypothetical protein